jgi:hypothetical protein
MLPREEGGAGGASALGTVRSALLAGWALAVPASDALAQQRKTLEDLPKLVLGGAFAVSGPPNSAGRVDEAEVLRSRAFILDQVDTARPAR